MPLSWNDIRCNRRVGCAHHVGHSPTYIWFLLVLLGEMEEIVRLLRKHQQG